MDLRTPIVPRRCEYYSALRAITRKLTCVVVNALAFRIVLPQGKSSFERCECSRSHFAKDKSAQVIGNIRFGFLASSPPPLPGSLVYSMPCASRPKRLELTMVSSGRLQHGGFGPYRARPFRSFPVLFAFTQLVMASARYENGREDECVVRFPAFLGLPDCQSLLVTSTPHALTYLVKNRHPFKESASRHGLLAFK